MPVHTWGRITAWIFTFGIQEYTTWSKGIMQYSLEMHENANCVFNKYSDNIMAQS